MKKYTPVYGTYTRIHDLINNGRPVWKHNYFNVFLYYNGKYLYEQSSNF